jgi:hypothetical protein
MKTIYKYKINLEYCQKLEIHGGFKILKLSVIDDICYIWALVDTDNDKVEIEIYSFMTGGKIDVPDLNYIDSYRVNFLIVHVFWGCSVKSNEG